MTATRVIRVIQRRFKLQWGKFKVLYLPQFSSPIVRRGWMQYIYVWTICINYETGPRTRLKKFKISRAKNVPKAKMCLLTPDKSQYTCCSSLRTVQRGSVYGGKSAMVIAHSYSNSKLRA